VRSDNLRAVLIVGALAAAIGASLIVIRLIAGSAPPDESISVPTAPRPHVGGCRLALLGGPLVPHPVWGVAVGDEEDPQLVFWPHGFTAKRTGDGANLLDADGRVVAHTGDQVRASGGLAQFGGREGFLVCPTDLHFEPAIP
jgi:hypothetical protein